MRRPRITDDHPWLRYVYTTVAGLLITFSICLWKGVFRETDTALIVRYLSDAFLIPGVLLTGVGLLSFIRKQGAYDGLGYTFTTLMVLVPSLLPLCINETTEGSVFGFTLITLFAALLFVSLPITLMRELWRNSEHPFGDALHTLLPAIYCALPLGLMSILHYEFNILMMCIIMVWVNDSFAYMGGSLFGKHKMWPKHSPGKTWEGTAIGLAACVAVGLLIGPKFNALPYHDQIGWPIWLLLALVCSIIGTLGDLVESMLKRSVGLKDSGNIMPGHGGFLDRFDSLLMIIPFATLIAMLALGLYN